MTEGGEGHLTTGAVHDLAEGLLDAPAAAAAERHVATCAACAAEVEAVRGLRAAAAALPDAIDPGVDLRAGIRAGRWRERPYREAARGAGTRPTRATWLAAAAVALAAIPTALAIGWLVGGGEAGSDAGPVAGSVASGAEPAARTVLTLDREYARAARELTATVEAGRAGLSPEAARLLDGSLDTVEKALAESRAALREDPGSPVLRELVLAMHRQRLDMLRQAAALAAESEGRS